MKKIFLTKDEVESLKNYCDSNLAVGVVEVIQDKHSGIGYFTWVQVKDLPETRTDISDIDS
jgi:hypothetical protein